MIIKYISCDGLEHEEKIIRVAGCEGELTCYRDADDWFDLGKSGENPLHFNGEMNRLYYYYMLP